MAHLTRDKKKLLDRVRRIKGQIQAIETALEEEHEHSAILQNIAGCRGAINGLMAEVMEGHIRLHLVDTSRAVKPEQSEAMEELIEVLKTYLK